MDFPNDLSLSVRNHVVLSEVGVELFLQQRLFCCDVGHEMLACWKPHSGSSLTVHVDFRFEHFAAVAVLRGRLFRSFKLIARSLVSFMGMLRQVVCKGDRSRVTGVSHATAIFRSADIPTSRAQVRKAFNARVHVSTKHPLQIPYSALHRNALTPRASFKVKLLALQLLQ